MEGEENMFGLDLHNNTENVWTENGIYSARLFVKRAEEIAANHDANNVRSNIWRENEICWKNWNVEQSGF